MGQQPITFIRQASIKITLFFYRDNYDLFYYADEKLISLTGSCYGFDAFSVRRP